MVFMAHIPVFMLAVANNTEANIRGFIIFLSAGGWPGLGSVCNCGHEDRKEDITAAILGKV